MSGKGLVIAATSSRSGKTTFTMVLARALRNKGHKVRGAKSGPDYIDPAFHAVASGSPCVNLDAWAMSDDRLSSLVGGEGLVLVEGAMGLFDGATDGTGSSADLAKKLRLPVILAIDCASMSQSVAALVSGFISHDPELEIAGIVLNRVGSDRHEAILREALSTIMTPILGVIRRSDDLKRASRHLGLVQASEDPELDRFLDTAAKSLASTLDIEIISGLAAPLPAPQNSKKLPPLGIHIAIAKDEAFTFIYPHLLKDWQDQGVALSFFSPLADQTPSESADAIYLPGGYPELHAQRITRAGSFRAAMRRAAQNNTTIYGECGGYMVLGNSLTDARDIPFPMLGLLDLDTSFSKRKLQLGYRNLSATKGPLKGRFKAHEFHYATILRQNGTPLFEATDATGCINTQMGLVSGSVSGSFAHIIDRA